MTIASTKRVAGLLLFIIAAWFLATLIGSGHFGAHYFMLAAEATAWITLGALAFGCIIYCVVWFALGVEP